MKRLWALVALGGVIAAAAWFQHFQSDRIYRGLLTTGDERLAASDPSAAIEAFSGALALRPTSMVAHFRRGAAYRAQGQRDQAIRDLQEAIRLAPDSTAPFIALGDLYASEGNEARAADWYGQAATRLRDQDPSLLYRLALAHYRAGAPAAAVEPLQRLIARNDSVGEAHYLLGLAYRDTQRTDDAIAALERAVKVAPSLTPAREELADLYRAQGRPVEEMAQLQALAALDAEAGRPQVARTVAMALALSRHGQFDGAVATLSDSVTRAPGDPRVQVALGRALLGRAERAVDRASLGRAMTALNLALAATTDRSEPLALLGHAHFLAGDFAGAEQLLREAVATMPVDPEAFGFLADTAERMGHDLDARDALANLDAIQGDTAAAPARAARAARLGVISLRVNDPKSAAAYFGHAVEGGLGDARTWGLLSRTLWQIGDRPGARTALTRAFALDPRSPELAAIARTVR